MLKAVVKRLAAVAALNMMRRRNDGRRIRTAPAQQFDVSALGPAPDIRAIMADSNIAAHWSEDAQAVERVYGRVNIPGGVNPGDRRAIYHLVHALKPRAVLESGTHVACSTVAVGPALQRVGSSGRQITTVDPADWQRSGSRLEPDRPHEDGQIFWGP